MSTVKSVFFNNFKENLPNHPDPQSMKQTYRQRILLPDLWPAVQRPRPLPPWWRLSWSGRTPLQSGPSCCRDRSLCQPLPWTFGIWRALQFPWKRPEIILAETESKIWIHGLSIVPTYRLNGIICTLYTTVYTYMSLHGQD